MVPLRVSDYYAPAVIVLLLQHFAVTFAGLSIVRDERWGTMELFRVAPLSAIEILLGKYLSYMIFAGSLAAILTGLVVFGLGVPMLGNWTDFALTVAALIFTSLGLGFLISLLARTTSQAVQFSMIVLLASIFFTGFFLSIQALWPPVRVLSWMLPATYGIQLLQNVMLRGELASPEMVANLALIGLNLFLLAWLLLHRALARS
jgi:ABC-2 type transport system permease protein